MRALGLNRAEVMFRRGEYFSRPPLPAQLGYEAGLAKGDFVLLPAASSSIGLAAIQLANLVGAIPIALTRTDAKAAALREAGPLMWW